MITVTQEPLTQTQEPLTQAITMGEFATFDIETGPLPDDVLLRLCPEFVPPAHPGEFDQSTVKLGNLKDQAKINDKISQARMAHLQAVEQYDANVIAASIEHFAKFREKAALDATTGYVVAIGLATATNVSILSGSLVDELDELEEQEAWTLRTFWGLITELMKSQTPIVGFNIKHFDLPFLVRRSWILGVPVPSGVRVGRYWSELFIDLMEVWQQGERGYISLDALAAAFGLDGKVKEIDGVEISGATFHELWKTNREVAVRYLEQDMLLPALLAKKMGVV